MNPLPFSLETDFLPEHAQEDKVDLELGGWEVHGLGKDRQGEHAFKQYASSPPGGSADMAWPGDGTPAMFGWFFTRPATKGKDAGKLLIRRQSLTDKSNNRRHEAPLCGGYCLFYRDKKPHPETGNPVHRAKLRLALNVQRFIRHQARKDNASLPRTNRLQRWRESRNTYGDEFSYDEEDNWIPHEPAWDKFAAREWFRPYVELIAKQVDETFERACVYSNAGELSPAVTAKRIGKPFSLSTVETLWEFPSENPVADVFDIGAKLMHLKRQGAFARESQRVRNSPCIVVPIAQGVKLKLYAKTNRRIRFEIVQTGLGKQLPKLIEEAHALGDPWDGKANWGQTSFVPSLLNRSWEILPAILKALRHRAAEHMNQVMKELRKGRVQPVRACSVVNLMAEVAAAVPRGFKSKATRLSEIRDLLFMLCYQRGFRGDRKTGPLAEAITELETAGVVAYDRSRQFYILSEAYVLAADSLLSATGEPLLTVFGLNPSEYSFQKGGKHPVRLRE
ncbi:MAG: hypothetical protein ABJF10_09655 [Chthoniobacter sp.]|uniref:hypothetical protein n=1 Tax=Chthoniobacter sp. TaxID=2510640 RepID=UPI0032A4B2BA